MRRLTVLIITLSALFFLGAPFRASAATVTNKGVWRTTLKGALDTSPGETVPLRLRFGNTGKTRWEANGKNKVELRLDSESATLFKSVVTAPLAASVAPGGEGYVRVTVKAPKKSGKQHIHFSLRSGGKTIPGTESILYFNVGNISRAAQQSKVVLMGERVEQNIETAIVEPGGTVSMRVVFKNKSKITWRKTNTVLREASAKDGTSLFWNDLWVNKSVAAVPFLDMKPGESRPFLFVVRAPTAPGTYAAHFQIEVAGRLQEGASADLILTVPAPPGSEVAPRLTVEPMIRVGLYTADDRKMIVTSEVPLAIQNIDGTILGTMLPGDAALVAFDYKTDLYRVETVASGVVATSTVGMRLTPPGPDDVLTITDYQNYSGSYNDNKFRGTLELRALDNGYVWVINELPLELYLRGLAEDRDAAPTESLKALAVAARTYAVYHYTYPFKHEKGGFTMNATQDDQVYRGYVRELRQPNFVLDVETTRGEVVTYNNEIAVTPYFARSSGRTRPWEEVWGGKPRPWLVSVEATYDIGKTRLGHGVGMSQQDSAKRAEAGAKYAEILQYYYRGTQVEKWYP